VRFRDQLHHEVPRTTVYTWHKHFRNGRRSSEVLEIQQPPLTTDQLDGFQIKIIKEVATMFCDRRPETDDLSLILRAVIETGQLMPSKLARYISCVQNVTDRTASRYIENFACTDSSYAAAQQFYGRSVLQFLAPRERQFLMAVDWTDFDSCNQTTLVAALILNNRQALPVCFKTVSKNLPKMITKRDVLTQLSLLITAAGIHRIDQCVIVADREFATEAFLALLRELGLSYIIRFKSNCYVTSTDGKSRSASDWYRSRPSTKQPFADPTGDYPINTTLVVQNARWTKKLLIAVDQIIVHKEEGMKDIWSLICSNPNWTADDVLFGYSRRWGIEYHFRNTKSVRYGRDFEQHRVNSNLQRDRMWLIANIASIATISLGKARNDLAQPSFRKRETYSVFRKGLDTGMFLHSFPPVQRQLILETWSRTLQDLRSHFSGAPMT